MSINEVCQKCRDVIEWKIKYRKYKALKAPAACNKCLERKIKKAYHVLCRDCAIANKQCAKCLRTEAEVAIIPPEPTDEEKLKLQIEMKHMIQSLSERKRRTFLRFMNGKKKRKNKDSDEEDDGEAQNEKEPVLRRTREELLRKIEKLKLGGEEDPLFDGVLEDDDEDDIESYDSDDFSSGGEE